MAYIGVQPADAYTSFAVQHFTTSATTSYTLDNPVANENEIALFINNVRQEPGSSYAYTASGTTLTLSAATTTSDTMYCVFIGKAVQTVTPASGSVTNDMLSSGSFSNITGTGTLTNFTSTGIDDNADATAITIDSSENVGIGTTSPSGKLHVVGNETYFQRPGDTVYLRINTANGTADLDAIGGVMRFRNDTTERMRIDASGYLLYGTTSNLVYDDSSGSGGIVFRDNYIQSARQGGNLYTNRIGSDGDIIIFHQDGNEEGNIRVSGNTISYNGFTGTHWTRLSDNSKPTILKGTILESLDEMMDWYQVQFDVTKTDDEGNETTTTKKESYALGEGESVGDVITYTYEGTDYQATIIKEGDVKHSKCKVSNTSESKAVYGVFMDWDNDDDTVNDMFVAQTGTFVVRLNSSVTTLNKGDLIQSNGDGTGKVQADDIIRASTVAKVLSTTKIETYSDGSYIVPCSLHC